MASITFTWVESKLPKCVHNVLMKKRINVSDFDLEVDSSEETSNTLKENGRKEFLSGEDQGDMKAGENFGESTYRPFHQRKNASSISGVETSFNKAITSWVT